MFPLRRTLTLFLALLLLAALVGQINHVLSAAQVYLFVGGLAVTYAALMLPLRDGLCATVLGGLLADATAPVAFGTHALLFGLAHVFIFRLRDRLPREATTSRIVIALLLNLAMFLLFSFSQIARLPSPSAAWPRLIVDLLASQVFLAVIAPWFFALQARTLILVGAERPEFD